MLGFGLVRVDTIFRLRPMLPPDGSRIFRLSISKIAPLLLTPLKLAKLANVLRPIVFILLRLCNFIMLHRLDRLILNKIGQASWWTLCCSCCYSPENIIALLKLLALALTAVVMYNPGAVAKSIAFICVVSLVIARITLRLLKRAGLLMYKFVNLLARHVFGACLRCLGRKCCYRSSHII